MNKLNHLQKLVALAPTALHFRYTTECYIDTACIRDSVTYIT